MPWPCMLITATDTARLSLRRYSSAPCPLRPYGMSVHDARVLLGTAPIVWSKERRRTWDVAVEQPPHDDPSWPPHCICGYEFQEKDVWQLSRNMLYTRPDTGGTLTIREVEPGMMWDAPWYLDLGDPWAGPDGRCLVLQLPDNTPWVIDGPATGGGGWTRTGEPPILTVTPSILSKGYHGFLTNGVLTDDTDGRRY